MPESKSILVDFGETPSVPEGAGEYHKGSACYYYDPSTPPPEYQEILPGIRVPIPWSKIFAPHGDFLLLATGEDLVVYAFEGRCGWHELSTDDTLRVEEQVPTGKLCLSMDNFPDGGEDVSIDAEIRCVLNPSSNLWCVQIGPASSSVEYVRIGSCLVAGIADGKYLSHLFITDIRVTDE
jgi:hypothetical protein